MLNTRRLTFAVFLILLLTRLAAQALLQLIFGATTPLWFAYFYVCSRYTLTGLLIWLNRKELSSLNVDKIYIIIFAVSGILLFLFYIPGIWGL
ncbi:MAG TPA: hypothetical protein VLZ89_10095, partial [Anaerolineales bacterium]|nr:hypothetical protein [Anaerolineales bacterium]